MQEYENLDTKEKEIMEETFSEKMIDRFGVYGLIFR